MDDEGDNSAPAEPTARRQAPFGASEKKAALERTAKWREDKARTVWPPAPVGFTETVAEKPARKSCNSIFAGIGVVFMTLWAFFVGFAAGIGHKDFSESLIGNIGYALFDLLLWSLPILYWLSVLKAQWIILRAEPTVLKKIVFFVSFGILAAIYGSGLWISLVCLTARAAASDTTY